MCGVSHTGGAPWEPRVEQVIGEYDMCLMFSSQFATVYRDRANSLILKRFKNDTYITEKYHLNELFKNDVIKSHIPCIVEYNDKERFILMNYKGVDGIELINAGKYRSKHWELYIKQCVPLVSEIIKLGYVHRDIKPENVVYDEASGLWSFIDFGFMECKKMTRNNSFKGTYPYCMPLLGNKRMLHKFLQHNKLSDIKPAGDYYGFAMSALSMWGHNHESDGCRVNLDLVHIYDIILTGMNSVLCALARIVMACVDYDYGTLSWGPPVECKFITKVDIDWGGLHFEPNVEKCWGHLVDTIIKKQKVPLRQCLNLQ